MAEGEDSDVSPASRPPGPGSVRNPRPLRVARVPHRRCSALLGACIAALAAHSWAGFFGSNRASSSARFGGPGRRPDGSGGPFGARAMARPWPYCHAGPGPLPPDPSHVHNRGPPARAGPLESMERPWPCSLAGGALAPGSEPSSRCKRAVYVYIYVYILINMYV